MNITAISKELNIEAFVVPNKASKISGYLWGQEQLTERTKEIYSLNNIDADPEQDCMLQLWMIGGGSKDMSSHGFHINHDGWDYSFRMDDTLPVILFKDKKEGDVVDIILSMKPRYKFSENIFDKKRSERTPEDCIDYEDDEIEAPEFLVTFHIKLNQQEYRYARFGKFEDAYKTVCQ